MRRHTQAVVNGISPAPRGALKRGDFIAARRASSEKWQIAPEMAAAYPLANSHLPQPKTKRINRKSISAIILIYQECLVTIISIADEK